MKTQSIQKHSLSNKIAKVGASVGAIGSGVYLLKNADDIFKKNIKNAKAFNSLTPKVFIPASIAAGIFLAGAIVGKTAGLIVEKIKMYKETNELKKILPGVLSEEIKNIKPISVEDAFKELDSPSLEDLGESEEVPFKYLVHDCTDYAKSNPFSEELAYLIDAQILPQEKIATITKDSFYN